jgi:glycine/D-amino acid oxidase-like deaminating enzyme
MNQSWDVVVVGGGIVGAACARECASRGLKTAVVESGVVGGGATAAGMGHIVVMDDSPAQLALTHYSQSLWVALAEQMPDDVEFERCGTLWVAADDEEMDEVRHKQVVYAGAGVATEILDGDALAEEEPHLRRPMAGALLVPSDAVVYPPCAAAWMMREAVRAGATLCLPRRVVRAGQGCARLDDGSELHAARIVIACGADSMRLLPEIPVRKRKGHGSLSWAGASSARRTGLSQKRALGDSRFGSVQRAAAQDGTGPDRFLTPVRRRGNRGRSCDPVGDAGASEVVSAGDRLVFGNPRVDRVPRCDAG